MTPLIDAGGVIPKASTEIFYGLGMPILGTLKALDNPADVNWFKNDRIFPVHYNRVQFINKAKIWCSSNWVHPNNEDNEDDPRNKMYPIRLKRCAAATWIDSLLDHGTFYPDGNLKNGFYIPSQREFTGRDSWTIGAAALIARAQNSGTPGLKGCENHPHGLEVMGIFNGSTDVMEDGFVDPANPPVFTADTQLIKSFDVPSSAKFIPSLSDNNFITVQASLSFANFAFFAVILIAVGAWVYRRALRRASSNISLPGDIVKF